MELHLTQLLKKKRAKKYLESIAGCRFNSLTDLLFALFTTYKKESAEWQEAQLLLEGLKQSTLDALRKHDYYDFKEWLAKHKTELELETDTEYIIYKLIDAVMKEEVLAYIDGHVVANVNQSISITDRSTISFIDTNRINQIGFTTI